MLVELESVEEKGVALFNLGRYEQAISALNSLAFQTIRSRCYAAAAAMSLDNRERSSKAVSEAVSIRPELTASIFLKRESYRDPDDAARLRALLMSAGLRD
jgi:hypothetical protein